MDIQFINTFQDIKINPNFKTLVICDIDNTVIKSKINFNYFFNEAKLCFPDYTHEMLIKEACDMQHVYNQIFGFEHTDLEGFNKLLEKINKSKSNSQLVFLTARKKKIENFTITNFKSVGLNYDNFVTYYTDNIKNKGQYILDHIDLIEFEYVIFIDDSLKQIKSVLDVFKNKTNYLTCYKFEIPGYKEVCLDS